MNKKYKNNNSYGNESQGSNSVMNLLNYLPLQPDPGWTFYQQINFFILLSKEKIKAIENMIFVNLSMKIQKGW